MIKKTLKTKNQKFDFESFEEAISFLKQDAKENPVKFDEKIDLVITTNINPKSESIKTIAELTTSSKEKKTVGVIIGASNIIDEIKDMENIIILGDEEIKKIKSTRIIPFDVCVCSTSALHKIAILAPILGPKGLMPNLQNKTLLHDEKQTKTILNKIISGSQVSIRNNKSGDILLSVGRISTDSTIVKDNCIKILEAVRSVKPKEFKGIYLDKVRLNRTMGSGSCKVLKF